MANNAVVLRAPDGSTVALSQEDAASLMDGVLSGGLRPSIAMKLKRACDMAPFVYGVTEMTEDEWAALVEAQLLSRG